MKRKIQRVTLSIAMGTLIVVCLTFFLQIMWIRRNVIIGNDRAAEKVETMSLEAMDEQVRKLLSESSMLRSKVADNEFSEFRQAIEIIANTASDIYAEPEKYGESSLKKYDESDMGKLVTYAAFGNGVDGRSADIQSELSRLSNMQGLMISINESNPSMAANYFESSSGIFLGTEPVSEYNLPEGDKLLEFDGRERPWYTMAVEAGEAVFTGIIKDVDKDEYAITCGIPVYVNGELKGVAGSGLFLDTIREDVDSFKLGENGYACIINNQGQVLFSGAKSGEMSVDNDGLSDLRNSSNSELAETVKSAVEGNTDIKILTIDGEDYYLAFAPMETVGWSYFTVLPSSEVMQPSVELLDEITKNSNGLSDYIKSSFYVGIISVAVLMVIVAIIAVFISRKFADRLAMPVVELTENIKEIKGDNLDFRWDMDTNDEIQTLAESFASLTERMKKYIVDITKITAEKERIGAELSVATNIQASMLPCIFPPFPERKEFSLYAKMDPAKEVGGDFYDFFLVDDNHLAVVIADVSGKGVPAALFMVIAKTLIKNHAQLGESVEDIFMNSNDQMCEGNGEDMFVTAWIGIIDLINGKMTFSDAGHEYPYLMHKDGSVEMLKPAKKKMPLASIEGMAYVKNEIELTEGDMLFLYTDGVAEATNSKNELYGTDRLEIVLKANYDKAPEELLTAVRENVDTFVAEAPQFDDLTMLAVKIEDLGRR